MAMAVPPFSTCRRGNACAIVPFRLPSIPGNPTRGCGILWFPYDPSLARRPRWRALFVLEPPVSPLARERGRGQQGGQNIGGSRQRAYTISADHPHDRCLSQYGTVKSASE